MAIHFKIYPDLGLVFSEWSEVASDSRMHKAYKALYQHPAWRPGFHEVTDLTAASIDSLTPEGFKILGTISESYSKGKCELFKSAVVVPDDLTYGMTRLYQINTTESPEEIQVFRDVESALEWAGYTLKDLDAEHQTLICKTS